MTFQLKKEFRFEAAHQLPLHDGACRNLHGHSYRFILEVRGPLIESGPKTGMVMDYKDISAVGKEIVAKLDHTFLNDHFDFHTTAENLSKWAYDFCKPRIPLLYSVTFCETESSSARFCPYECGT